MNKRLNNVKGGSRVNILITGGTKGIGKATALRFSAPGNHLFLNYFHDDAAAARAKDEVTGKGGNVHLLKCNVGNYHEVREMAAIINKEVDSIDVIVHCATGIVRGDSLEIDPEEWRNVVEVSSLSLIDIVREIRPLLKYGSSIIALSSRGARKATKKYAALGSTKAFTESIIRYMAVELAPHGIRANVVSAGALDTEAFRSMFAENADTMLEQTANLNPSGRNLSFDDVTETIAFLASPGAQMIQGEVIHIDGGLSLK
jgi:enoyl-[acyl-carrier protein] reductase III